MLEDGTYDIVVIDAESTDGATVRIEVTVLAGPHKGEVFAITATGLARDPLDLLAAPGTVTVVDGEPRLTLEG